MNIIDVVDNKIVNVKPNNKFKIEEKKENIYINILKDSDFYLEIKSKDHNLNLNIHIEKNIKSRVFIFSKLTNVEIHFIIKQEKNSNLTINAFNVNKNVNKSTKVELDGVNSTIEFNDSYIGETDNKLKINHNYSNTNSIVKSHAISKKEIISFEVTEYVPKGSINCNLSQVSKIINLGDNKCTIKPILLIDEEDVNAFHSSVITPINNDDLLYMMSRGIDEDSVKNLLTNGFLISNLSINDKERNILFEKHIFRR